LRYLRGFEMPIITFEKKEKKDNNNEEFDPGSG
jgi:hypothetical protein